MSSRVILRALGRVVRQEGGKAARKLSAKIWVEANRQAMSKGLVEGPVTWEDALSRLKKLYHDGSLDKSEFQRLKEEVREFFRKDGNK